MSNQEYKMMSKGQSQTGTQPVRRTLERCKFKGKTKNVVYVDVENGKTHDVILIDAPEFSQKRVLGSSISPKKLENGNFISIDDDEVHVEESDNRDKGGSDQDCGGTSSKAFCPAFSQAQNSNESNFDEFGFRHGKSPMKFSKSRRTYSEKTFSKNRFGLSQSSDSSFSDSDSSDCELMEGSSGNIREQWERAASKKRKLEDVLNGHPGRASGSGSSKGTPKNFEVQNTTKQHVEEPFCSTSSDNTSTASGDGATRNAFVTPEEDLRVFEDDLRGHSSLHEASGSGSFTGAPKNVEVENTAKQHVEFPFCSTSDDTKNEKDGPVRDAFLKPKEAVVAEPSKAVVAEPSKAVEQNSTSCCRTPLKFSEEHIYQNGHVERESEVIIGSVSHQDNGKPAPNNCAPSSREDETHVILQEPIYESNNNTQSMAVRSTSHDRDGICTLDADHNIIGEREKFKETDEYKRADEEEWASRQHQLQLQAEEVQKLRKRKKAEAQRLLDMERRQKERVEEMREAQKKNVETINLKEQLRAEVRKELQRLELIHTDMASLLRALDIRVGSGGCPTSQEVNAAYKQALLRFHPDRASKTDIRQQVEAEEKFKLVSRVRGKLTNVTTTRPKHS